MIERTSMGVGQVFDVNVVTDTGTIRGVVVGAKNLDAFDFSRHGHHHARNEVGLRIVIFADFPVGRTTTGIKVAQASAAQSPRTVAILENPLHHQFAAAIGIDGVLLVRFCDWQFVRHSVSGAGRGKHEHLASEFLHHLKQLDRLRRVVLVILERIRHRFPHVGVGSKMDHRAKPVLLE